MTGTAKASVTAEFIALHRAVEMLRPEEERVCHDPLAVRFISPEWVALISDREKLMVEARKAAQERPGINGAIVARVRFIDEVVLQYVEEGLAQLVILGAGYDSRAYRIGGIKENVHVFEVDHPLTQQIKIRKLVDIFGEKPGHVTFVPVDFAKDDLKVCLLENGYDPAKRTLFIMEGLAYYMPAETLDGILAFIAKESGPHNAIVFDYLPPSVVNGTSDRIEGKGMWTFVQSHGEPLRLGLENDKVAAFLSDRGFDLKNNLNAPDCKEMYFRGQSRQRPITPIFWFAHAQVK